MSTLSMRHSFFTACVFLLGLLIAKNYYAPVCSLSYSIFHSIHFGLIQTVHTLSKPIVNTIESCQQIKTFQIKMNEIIKENSDLKERLIFLESSQRFNRDTADLINFQKRYKDYYKLLGQVILKQCSQQNHFLLLDIGAKHGVAPEMIAVYKNCLIGRVSEVFPYYCKVLLITDRSCKVAVFCAKTQTEGIYEGTGIQNSGELQHVSHLEKLEQNDLLITSGQGYVFPRGFGVGRVASFEVQDVNYNVSVKPMLDIMKLDYCYLMLKGASL